MTTTENGQRDELVKALWGKKFPYGGAEDYVRLDANAAHAVADAVLAAGYREPRTITTDDAAASLPEGTVVRDSHACLHERGENGWWTSDGDEFYTLSLPATVLWEPAAGAGA